MICEDGFVFRKGKKGDKLPSVSIQRRDENDLPDENDFPDFVLELNNKQVASACGGN